MAEFSPNGITHYRANTEKHAKHFSMTLNRKLCRVCGGSFSVSDGKSTPSFSRYEPATFCCHGCLAKEDK